MYEKSITSKHRRVATFCNNHNSNHSKEKLMKAIENSTDVPSQVNTVLSIITSTPKEEFFNATNGLSISFGVEFILYF